MAFLVSTYLNIGIPYVIKLYSIVILLIVASTSSTLASIATSSLCPRLCSCYEAAVDCTGKSLKILTDKLPRTTKTLILDDNELQSVPDVSYLLHLEKLVLSRNNIKNINASQISNLISLKELDLRDNKLQTLPPHAFEPRNKLQKLDLSYNNLSDISGLSSPLFHLKHLNIQHNRIRNLDIIHTNKMPMLNVLRAGHNDIKELVSALDKKMEFPRLHVLEFNNNKIERIHMFLTRFKYIRKLVLSHNKLRSINASSFIRNTDMEELWLDHNELTSVTNLWLTFKPKLTYLDLSYNRIHSIDSGSFQSAQHIKYLDISNNNLGALGSKIFYHLHNLSYLNMHNNDISMVSEDAFHNLHMLLSLNISSNHMNLGDKEFDSVFKPLTLLKILDLNKNNILMVPSHAFAGLANLKTLYMKKNRLTVIETDAFAELRSISKLHFDTDSLICDCSLKYLRTYIRNTTGESKIRGVCASPSWLKGRDVKDIFDFEVECDHDMKPTVRPVILEGPKSTYVHLRSNTSLRCSASSSVESDITINWYQQLPNRVVRREATSVSPQRLVSTNEYRRSSLLNLRNVRFHDGGKYWCHVSNKYGSNWSREANITVVVRPSLSPNLRTELEARSGEHVHIPCSAEGVPQPTVRFTKSHKLTFHALIEKRIVYKKHKIWIENLKIEDSGMYSCTARSPVGVANATIRLVVIEKPKFVRPMKSKSFSNGSTAVIDCIISGNPRPKISWYKNGVLLKSSTNKVRLSNQLLVIMAFGQSDEGEYACQASNRLGTVRTTANLTVRPVAVTAVPKMASDVFISIIVVVVVVVVILTSLAWVTLICCFRKRRRLLQEKQNNGVTTADQFAASYPGESLLDELPKDYVLRCNGKLVTVKQSDAAIVNGDEPTDALLFSEKLRLHRNDEHLNHFYSIPTLGDMKHTDNEDDSGISIVYSKYPRDPAQLSRDVNINNKFSTNDSAMPNSNSYKSCSSNHSNTINNASTNKTLDDNSNHSNTKETRDSSILSSRDLKGGWRKSKPPAPSSSMTSYHPPSYVYCDDNYLTLTQKKQNSSGAGTGVVAGETNTRLHHSDSKNNLDFSSDPARLKLHVKSQQMTSLPPSSLESRYNNYPPPDCLQDNDDYYHSYVTSSSGIESGGSSENISLNSEDIISSAVVGVVAV